MGELSPALLHDAVRGPIWLGVNALLLWSAWRIADLRRQYSASMSHRIMEAGVLYTAAIVFCLTLLGCVGLFTGDGMLAAVGTLAGMALLVLWQKGQATAGGPVQTKNASAKSIRIEALFWGLLLALLCAHVVVDGLLKFPTDFDSLMYHMPIIDHWGQAGSLYAPDSCHWSTPGNSELLAAWAIVPFSGDFLVGLNNLPIAIIWAAAAVELGRQLGLRRMWPHLAAFAVICVHTIIHETDDASNDLMVIAFCTVAAVYTLRYVRGDRYRDLLLLGVSFGLLMGVKYFALGYATMAIGGLVVGAFLRRGLGHSLVSAVVCVVVGLPWGAYWYARNTILTGLPLYPMGMQSATKQMGYPGIWTTSFLGNGSPNLMDLGMLAVWRMCGPIQSVAVGAALTVVVLLLGKAIAKSWQAQRLLVSRDTLLAYWILASFAILMITPFAVEDQPGTLNHLKWAYTPVRYGLCFLSFATFGLIRLIFDLSQRLGTLARRMLFVAISGLAAWQFYLRITIQSEADLGLVGLVGLSLFVITVAIWITYTRMERTQALTAILGCLLLIVATVGIVQLSERWHSAVARHFGTYFSSQFFENVENSYPGGTVICVYDNRPYAFFGSSRQNRIFNPRFADTEALEEFVKQNHIQYVVATTGKNGEVNRYRGILEALENSPHFYLVSSGSSYYHIFEHRDSVEPATQATTDEPMGE